jgi:hypothetical protein
MVIQAPKVRASDTFGEDTRWYAGSARKRPAIPEIDEPDPKGLSTVFVGRSVMRVEQNEYRLAPPE